MEKKMESDTLGKLAEALSKAQGAMTPAKKESINPHFRSTYADLASCWAAIREPLAANGLAITQRLSTDAHGVRVETMLLHTSGEFLRDEFWLPVSQKTPIGYASAVTYARRYSLSAMVGLSSDSPDDDGTAASMSPNGLQVHHSPAASRPMPKPAQSSALQFGPGLSVEVPTMAAPMQAPVEAASPVQWQDGGPVVPFGKKKGTPIAQLDQRGLEWYLAAAEAELVDPGKERFRAKTMAWVEALKAEIMRRTSA